MSRLVDDVLDFLQSAGLVGGASGWTRGANYLPPSPDKVIAVYDTGGPEPELAKSDSGETVYDELTFQVRGRGAQFGTAALRDQMGAIYRALHGVDLSPATGDTVTLLVRAIQSGPLPLGLDENERPGFTWNFATMRERGGN